MPLAPVERVLRFLLIEQARLARPITYKALARALGPFSPVRLERPYSPLHGWLGAVSTFELQANRPMLSALVINQDYGRPGEGFFKLAVQLGLAVPDKDAFWQAQLAAIFATWPHSVTALVTTHTVTLSDGRKVLVREYAGGPVRLLVDDPPYVISEAYLARGNTNRAILRLEPRVHLEPVIDPDEKTFEIMPTKAFRFFEWSAKMHGALMAMSAEERAALDAWERDNKNGHSVGTHHWPGWRKYIGPPPWEDDPAESK